MTTGSSSIDYESLQSEAMRGVVRAVLMRTAKSGLPGDHHFYISFDTNLPGVSVSKRLKEKYPTEMTIVLQHRFWDLIVSEERFEVKLTFDGIPERLVVPFTALKVFFDPSVRYGLQFEDAEMAGRTLVGAAPSADDEGTTAAATRTAAKKPRAPRKPKGERELAGNAAAENIAEVPRVPAANGIKPAKPAATAQTGPSAGTPADGAEPNGDKSDAASGAQILSLDQFRKK
jgi:hypothetical protein